MHTTLTFPVHAIPLWFLVISLFLPRLCIFVAWLQHGMAPYIPASANLIQIVVALLIPRILILFWIYQDQGIGIWFLIHAIALLCAWGGGGHRVYRRRRVQVIE
jgi:hypothetical protein